MDITPELLEKQKAALRPASIPRAPKPPSVKADGRAKLGPAGAAETEYVNFDFNPATIVISHTAPMTPSAGQGPVSENGAVPVALTATSVDELARGNGATSIMLRALTFDGKHVARVCLRLLSWTHPVPTTGPKRVEQPKLNFMWGSQTYLVHLNQVTAAYTRFSPKGMPVRATVDLTLHSIPKLPGPTNPSSGGLPGRRTHLLASAESLPELATRTYGGPGHWREIAAANRFDDPLRVRPGTLVYLPGAGEAEQ